MPDATTPDIKVDIKPVETLQLGGTEKVPGTVISDARYNELQAIRALRDQGQEGRDQFEALKREPQDYNSNTARSIERNLAGDRVQEVRGNIDVTRDATREEKANFQEGKRATETNDGIIVYTGILQEAASRNISVDDVITERNRKGDKIVTDRNINAIRERSLDAIANNPKFNEMFPELRGVDIDTKRKIIEDLVAKDPEYRKQLIKIMSDANEAAKALPPVEKDEATKQAEAARDAAQTKIDNTVDYVMDRLNDNEADLTEEDKENVKKLINDGKQPEAIFTYLRNKIITRTKFPHLDNFISAKQLETARDRAQAAYQTAQNAQNPDQTYIDRMRTAFEMADNAFSQNNQILNQYADEGNTLFQVSGVLDLPKEDPESIRYALNDIKQAKAELDKQQKVLDQKGEEAKNKETASRDARLAEMSTLVDKLTYAPMEALYETLKARYDQFVGLEKTRLTKEGDEKVKQGLEAVDRQMDGRWVEYNPRTRRRTTHGERALRDVRDAAYRGEDGIKDQMIDALGFLQDDGRRATLETLNDEQKRILNEVYAQRKSAYIKKLFTDFAATRGFLEKAVGTIPFASGEFGLKGHEWRLLEEKFNGEIEAGIEGNQTAKDALKAMREKGIVPTFKLKWLLYMLAALGIGITGLGAIGAVGIGIPAIAGAVASGAGATGGAVATGLTA